MARIKATKVKIRDFNFEELMSLAKYKRIKNGSYIKYFKNKHDTYRYHAYFVLEGIVEIHTDKIKRKYGKIRHQASNYQCREEKKRLRSLLPPVPPTPRKPRSIIRQEDMKRVVDRVARINRISSIKNPITRLLMRLFT